ncbi:hypothetical protein [Deinococcus sp. UYEF24]
MAYTFAPILTRSGSFVLPAPSESLEAQAFKQQIGEWIGTVMEDIEVNDFLSE